MNYVFRNDSLQSLFEESHQILKNILSELPAH